MSISDKIVTGAAGFTVFGIVTNRLDGRLTNLVFNRYAPLYKPIAPVSIVIPAFNEEFNIEKTLRSILSQNILYKYSDFFECIVVNNESTDRTAEIAKQYCQVISAPKGKLNARHKGMEFASGNIIVSCDADCYYPPNWLNLLIRHFCNPNVVAVNAPFLIAGNLLKRLVSVWFMNLSPTIRMRMSGANSAFLRKAYYAVGGFDLSIDQFSREEIITEEEIVFYGKLRSVGEVVFEIKAPCFTIERGHAPKVLIEQRMAKTEYLREIERGERF